MASAARPDGASQGMLATLRRKRFRTVWIANLAANFGWLIQGVGAAWLMTQLDPRPDMVALIQTATQAPILLLALIAGAAADVWDRRTVLIVAQAWVLGISALLAVLAWGGVVGPWLLLLLTFALGAGAALNGPAWQAVVRELVPARELAAAVTLNAVAFNLARSLGPALGGTVVAAAGAEAAFLLNALLGIGMLVVLFGLRRTEREPDLPRERVGGAVIAGLRYVSQAPPIQATLLRGLVFGFAAASVMALLPVLAREQMGGGPVLYGVLLGSFGVGAMGGAFLIHPMRHRLGNEQLVTILSGIFGAATLVAGLFPVLPVVIVALPFAGAAWLGAFSTFNIAVQMSSAFWVQARMLSIYQMVVFGGMALGSWIWGELAHGIGTPASLAVSGAVMLASLALHLVARLPGGEARDLRPAPDWQRPEPKVDFDIEEGPVLVLVEYKVALDDARAFATAMDEVGHLRRRDGARRWQLFQDTSDAEHWVEAFTVGSWLEHLRQLRRMTAADGAVVAQATRFHRDAAPRSCAA
ncbi:MAG: MFS transporter [Geminicoccaceae bacterium]